jgi:hypothetical protein
LFPLCSGGDDCCWRCFSNHQNRAATFNVLKSGRALREGENETKGKSANAPRLARHKKTPQSPVAFLVI